MFPTTEIYNQSRFTLFKPTEKSSSKHQVFKNSQQFPTDILIYIFSYLNIKDILKIALVCKAWSQASQHRYIWQNLFVRDFGNINPTIDISMLDRQLYIQKYQQIKRHYEIQILQSETITTQALIDEEKIFLQEANNLGIQPTPIICTLRSAGITLTSTGLSTALGFIIAPHIELPSCVVISFCAFVGCFPGMLGGTYYEQKHRENLVKSNQEKIAQIDNETQPLLIKKMNRSL